jgi:hypothetical protein
MSMRVDESGNNGFAAEVDSAGVRARELRDLLISSNSDEAVAPYGNGLNNRKAVIDGDDLAIGQNEVRCRLLAMNHRNGPHNDEKQHK